MKIFTLSTVSESGDHYLYHFQSNEKPTNEQIEKFLIEYGNDNEDNYTYESVLNVLELKQSELITI